MGDDDYKSIIANLADELILYRQRVARAQSEVRTALLVARASMTESFELLRKTDEMLRSQLRDRSADQPTRSLMTRRP